ncbi:TonB-dependent receptor [Flavivirga sp. 57AJ16]|uniref:SusC/RagA family TonB-linked outer membrane protein n=1 Tax=Flavivirga sp. 57AJ16 TaxID=3025307 RepID=UPI002365E6EC|nr:TonB-dependent receptor [Flavivirga sp. 57AJ16]MDD7885374.1 TonB-dependent receptor [Flavivirga sp. 57AJ16]
MKKRISYLCLLIAIMYLGEAYSQTITGSVTDDQNLPLPGVSIIIKGTQRGVVTDFDGGYTLDNVSANSLLEFSYIGFITQTITVGSQTTINVSLQTDLNVLDEIVVVGAVVKRNDLTGAVGNISGGELTETPSSNVIQSLQGRLSGVYIQQSAYPGATPSIQIRGNNSMKFGNNPIFVVDGLVMENAFEAINPNDVASVDVLKDASATAIYGSKASNGVIVITTKKGSRTGSDTIEYGSWLGVSEFSNSIPLMNANQLFDLRVDAFSNAYIEANPGADRNAYITQITSDGSDVFAQYELDAYRNGESYNWLDQVTRTGIQSNHNLSFSGGGDKGTYFISFNYADQKGLLKNSSFKRYNAKINLTRDVKPWLQVGTNTTFSRNTTTYIEGSAFRNALNANPFLAINGEDPYLKYADIENQDHYNPILSLTIDNTSTKNHLTSSNFINIKPMDGLNLRTTLSVDVIDQANFEYIPSTTGQSIRNSKDGQAHHYRYAAFNYQWDNTINYRTLISDKHDINVLGGFTVSKSSNNNTDVYGVGFESDDLTYHYLQAAEQEANNYLGSGFNDNSLVSFLGRVVYTYDRKYAITATTRFDASSKFPPKNRWGAFPSLSVSWDIARENFLKDASNINQLKLRVGYGLVGNQNIPSFGNLSLYRPSVSNGETTYQPYGYFTNPNLRWEKQKQFNVGVDMSLFNSKLGLSVDYFDIVNSDLLIEKALSPAIGFGYTQQIFNVGETTNKGIEITTNVKVLDNKDFSWGVTANISSAVNKVTKLFDGVPFLPNLGGSTGAEIQRTGNLFVGESINSIYVYEFNKIAQESDMDYVNTLDLGGRTVMPGDILPVDRNGDGRISPDDRYVVGKTDPDLYGGFSSNFNYKGFSLNTVFAYSIGGKKISGIYESFVNSNGLGAAHIDLLNRWTPTNTDTDIPRAFNGGGRFSMFQTDKAIQNASFLRLNALTLSYSLPNTITEKLNLKKCRVYVTGSNLFTITKYKGYDPEGGDNYPNSRMFVFGTQISL